MTAHTDLRSLPLSMRPAPAEGHAMGDVADDWEAAQVWLRAVGRNCRNGSTATIDTYGFHLAKLRWYCENVLRITPSRWSMQEVEAFHSFLENLPEDALCAVNDVGLVGPGQPGYTPFRKQPAKSSQADIRRFVHALFGAWHGMGYIRINPMALTGSRAPRKIQTERSLGEDVFNLVLDVMASEEVTTFMARQRQLRDRFILSAFKQLGLRASELVGARMGAFYQLYDPGTRKLYWIFLVTTDTGKGGKERRIPVPRDLLADLKAYREAFGLEPLPSPGDTTALLLSPKTRTVTIGERQVKQTSDRRFFGAWQSISTRQGLYGIVKQRLGAAAQGLTERGEHDRADRLSRASPHWLRHTFAKASLMKGQSMREVASLLGHASIDTTMIYTDQDALDLVRALERTDPGAIAADTAVTRLPNERC